MRNLPVVFGILTMLSACGGNPINVAKERDRSDEKRRVAEQKTAEVGEDNRLMKLALENVFVTKSFKWAYLGLGVVSHQESAAKQCQSIGFELPRSKDELNELYTANPDWKKYAIFTADDSSQVNHFVICRREITPPFGPDVP